MEACGNPHKKLPSIQVAGTNGKGSTSAMLSSILQSAGYNVGLFTSPHLLKMNERIRINNSQIDDTVIEEFIETYRTNFDKISASFFEILTALAFWYFVREKVDIAILETGLGGRLDSVTVCNPLLTVMTSISKDHTQILGDSLEKIAFEKAGSLKPEITCISCRQEQEVEKVLLAEAKRVGTEIKWVEKPQPNNYYRVGLKGSHQQLNASLAVQTLRSLPAFTISQSQINDGLLNVKWYGRYQIIQTHPLVIFDVGHNEDGISAFLDEFEKQKKDGKSVLLIALQSTKSLSTINNRITRNFDEIICTQTPHYGFMDAKVLSSLFSTNSKITTIQNLEKAIKQAMNQISKNDTLAIIGTHYLGEVISSYYNISFDNT